MGVLFIFVIIVCGTISCNTSSHAASIEEADPLDDQLIKELYDNSKSNSTDEEENHRDGKVLNLQDILDTVNPFSTGKSQNQIPGQHLGQHSGQHPGQQTGQYPGQQPGKHPGQQLGQHPHQLPHPGQHKLGKLQHSEQILPGKSGQNLPGQSLVARPLQSGRPSAPPRPGKSQINKKRLTERNDQVIRGSSGPNQIIHIMSFLQSMEDSQKARTNHIVKTLKKFDEDQKLRNNHILTVIDNLNSNMNSFFQKFESNQISRNDNLFSELKNHQEENNGMIHMEQEIKEMSNTLHEIHTEMQNKEQNAEKNTKEMNELISYWYCQKPNEHVNKLKGASTKNLKNIVQLHGWDFNIDAGQFGGVSENHYKTCGNNGSGWYGYKIGSPIGFIRTTLNGCGKARLDFGNCANVGYTQVKLDGNEISVANANEHSKIVEFTFQHGSVLELSDLNYGIIKFNNFHVVDDNLIKCIQCHREAENGEMKKQSEDSKTISNRHGQLYYPNPMNSLNLSYSTK